MNITFLQGNDSAQGLNVNKNHDMDSTTSLCISRGQISPAIQTTSHSGKSFTFGKYP